MYYLQINSWRNILNNLKVRFSLWYVISKGATVHEPTSTESIKYTDYVKMLDKNSKQAESRGEACF